MNAPSNDTDGHIVVKLGYKGERRCLPSVTRAGQLILLK